ncbi:class I SAM-dependent methyltransferase [Actinophytocola oryzae]|uniref:Methyltransferase family protein n=1 Tax=Actinophytocola oryzae TaxID=502181 RepID=A0A4R7VHD8_9PSEU|nr:methyltransferase domain-containing protein [Actinophytocola oryzae]TDV48742.1 methyltransferase family protein [Actinophytocola oryzae]
MIGVDAERYGDHVFSHGSAGEADRLLGLAKALDEGTFRRLATLRPRAEWRCLDIGAGLGTVSEWLAGRCPRGRTVAMDIDLRLLSGNGYDVVDRDVTLDEFPPGSFDLIHARWVFSHLPTRDTDLARVARWLAPGGWLVVEDFDQFPIESSRHPLYRKVSLAMCAAVARRFGTEGHWASGFPAPLRTLGLTDIGTETFVPSAGPTPMGRFWRLSAEQLAPDLRDHFGVTATELAEFVDLVESPTFDEPCLATVAAWGSLTTGPHDNGR